MGYMIQTLKKNLSNRFSSIITNAAFTLLGAIFILVSGAINFQLRFSDRMVKVEASTSSLETLVGNLLELTKTYQAQQNATNQIVLEKLNTGENRDDRIENKIDQLLLQQK